MTSPRHRALLGTVGASVLLLLATACGSGSDDSADGPPGETVPEATVDQPTGPSAAPSAPTPPATDGTSPRAPDDTDPTPADPTTVVPEVLQFTAPLVGGGTFDGATVVGKPTVFWFWAPT